MSAVSLMLMAGVKGAAGGGGGSTRTDNFNRSDSTTSPGTPSDSGSAWVVVAGIFGISTNKGYCVTAATPAIMYLEASRSDGTVSCDLATVASVSAYPQLIFRYVDSSNFWVFETDMSAQSLKVSRIVAGSTTTTYTGSGGAFTADSTITLSVILSGTSIDARLNGVSVATTTSSVHQSATKYGWASYANGAHRIDNFSVS